MLSQLLWVAGGGLVFLVVTVWCIFVYKFDKAYLERESKDTDSDE